MAAEEKNRKHAAGNRDGPLEEIRRKIKDGKDYKCKNKTDNRVEHTMLDDITTKQLNMVWTSMYNNCPKTESQNRYYCGHHKELKERELPDELWLNREEWMFGVGKRRRTF